MVACAAAVFAFQFVARAQALLQMLVSTWLSQTAYPEDKVLVTNVLSSALSVRQKQMIRGLAANPLYEVWEPFAPWA